nr:uncharacterized protein LOC124812598 [Hydra vulgaris]
MRISKTESNLIKKMIEEGNTTRKIASKLKVSQSTVQRIRKKCGHILKKNVGGRPKKLSAVDSRRVIRYLTTGEAKSTSHAAKLLQRDTGKNVSRWTVQRDLIKNETKMNGYSTDGRQWSWKREGEPLTQKDFIQTVKHGGGNIKLWECMTAYGLGPIRRIVGNMNKEMYLDILQHELLETVENMPYPINEVIFQQDNDPKHTAKMVKNWLAS